MTKDELIEKLPGDLKPWAEIWLPVLLGWSEDKLTDFFMGISMGMPWVRAYQKLVEGMTVGQKIAELKLRRQMFEKLNRDNAAFVEAQRTRFVSVIAKVILSLSV